MGKVDFTEEFERDAVRQITERSYLVSEVSQRLGSARSLYEWKKKFGTSGVKANSETSEGRLKKELARVTESATP